jgi:hypothetical protein
MHKAVGSKTAQLMFFASLLCSRKMATQGFRLCENKRVSKEVKRGYLIFFK